MKSILLALVSIPALCLPIAAASAFGPIGSTPGSRIEGGSSMPIQVKKHCKSVQSRCHVFRHNF